MATSSTYYIDANSFDIATSVYLDGDLSNVAPDGYYSFSGIARRQIFGKLTEVISCNTEPDYSMEDYTSDYLI